MAESGKELELNMASLKQARTSAKSKMTRIVNWVNANVEVETNPFHFQCRLETLESAFLNYDGVQDKIEALSEIGEDREDRDKIENIYYNTVVIIKDQISKLSRSSESLSPPASNTPGSTITGLPGPSQVNIDVKLPQINIKSFKGDTAEWNSFFQIFSALIINNHTLTDIQKFIYLKSFLRDEALNLVDSLQVTNENFPTALEILRRRYENKLSVINSHFNSLLDVEPMTKCNASALREFVTSCRRSLTSLKNLNYSEKQLFEFLIIYLLGKKIDYGTRRAFETERDLGELPELGEFLDFLETRCLILENLASTEKSVSKTCPKPKPQHRTSLLAPIHQSSSPTPHCLYCRETTHKIYTCNQFRNLPITEKRKFVVSNRLCFNCLGSKHAVNNCPNSKGCSVCNRRHHTLLHESHNNPIVTNTNSNQRPHQTRFIEAHSSGNAGGNQFERQINGNSSTPRSASYTPRVANASTYLSTSLEPHSRSARSIQAPTPYPNDAQLSPSNEPQITHGAALTSLSTRNCQVLLATAVISLYDTSGKTVSARAVLDNGSQNSFITKQLVTRLGLLPYNKRMQITGIALTDSVATKMVDVVMQSNVFPHTKFFVSCAILTQITSALPQSKVNMDNWVIPEGVTLADPMFMNPSQVDLLLGADLYYELLSHGVIRLGKDLPTLINTALGWIVGGSLAQSFPPQESIDSCSHLNVSLLTQARPNLETLVSKFWALEEVASKSHFSEEDQLAETIFESTTVILNDGTFQVDLPFRSPKENLKLGDSFSIARKRFENLEKRFSRDERYFFEYKKFINEYLSLGHAKVVPLALTSLKQEPKYFLPHHAVLKEDSVSTKLRVVFDASCRSSSGYALNDLMLKGYQVQPELYDILCRVRSFKFVLVCDIEKMFRQIKINPAQTFLLNILWRDNPYQELQCIELLTVTYGTNSAPFLATRVLKEIALRNENKYPMASRAILEQCYMDDVLSGADSLETLKRLRNELVSLMGTHNFSLHKWRTNCTQLDLEGSKCESTNFDINSDGNPDKVLGALWNTKEDFLGVSVPENVKVTKLTKRTILSVVAQCFDPLGLLAPVTITGKLIIQRLWLMELGWDDPINDESLLEKWFEFIDNLPLLSSLRIPRPYFLDKPKGKIELHGFADSSMKAYAACVYLRTTYLDGSVSCCLVSSKTRVAPLKTVSLPRLELCGMVLLAQLVVRLVDVFNNEFDINKVTLWSDSQVALCWIKSHPSRWCVFVANRVSLIQELTLDFSWNYVKTDQNPADLPSRGLSPATLKNSNLWWQGPDYLHDPNWTIENYCHKLPILSELPEARSVHLVSSNPVEKEGFFPVLFELFSSFSRTQRTLAYIFRFINNIKKGSVKLGGVLSVSELDNSKKSLLAALQTQCFSKELSEVRKGKVVTNKCVARLNPFLDTDGLLRVGGRLEQAGVPYTQKHPILLPSRNRVVSSMLKLEHVRLGHAGAQTVLSNFRLKYWPLDGLYAIKRVIRECSICFRYVASSSQQIMSDLPPERVNMARCFVKVGVDYGGPYLIKSSNLRKAPLIKAYIAIFVCLVTKAVHIELVTGLTTDLYLMTLKRFIARRGNPSLIYSDNATNFAGAKNQLKELQEFLRQPQHSDVIKDFAAQNQIQFKFIPPRSPHWGGIWEAAIKSAKYHLIRLVGNSKLTFEEFYTVLVQVEAILNSRPLCVLSNDPNDITPLTPGHFLIGSPLTSYPEKDYTSYPANRLTLFKGLSQIQQTFWRRWSIDYLNRLQNRPKWYRPYPNLIEGTIVLLKEDNTPPLKWCLARIVEVLPGKDGRVRAVKVKTSTGEFTRSITKIVPLPLQDPQSQSSAE